VFLFLATFAVYAQVRHSGFVNFGAPAFVAGAQPSSVA
jgi:hypothetical protein